MSDEFDFFLVERNTNRLMQYRKRICRGCDECTQGENYICPDHTKEFHFKLRFLQYNIPPHDLEVAMGEHGEIFERRVREYSLIDETTRDTPLDGYEELFDPYMENLDGKVYERALSWAFYGHNEAGKTITAIHILCAAIELGFTGYYIHFKDLMTLYNKADYGDEPDDKRLMNFIMGCDFLVVDEVGKESKTSDQIIGVFENLIKKRTSESKPTTLVMNVKFPHRYVKTENGPVAKGGFMGKYGYSVWNALMRNYRVIEFSPKGKFRERTREEWDL